tara:strand:+ start:389 stop:823 length:435 start_codon:yes stop_codon:yes gene_type:complete
MSNIDLYFDKMDKILNCDIILKIFNIINIQIIKKQKILKNKLNYDILLHKNIFYNDKNMLIYKNNANIQIKNKTNYNKFSYKLLKVDNNYIVNSNILFDNSNNLILDNNSSNILLDNNIYLNNDNILFDNINGCNIKIIVKYIN